jgi:hypothetical protein
MVACVVQEGEVTSPLRVLLSSLKAILRAWQPFKESAPEVH